MRDSPGRFVEIGDGQFIALTQEFRKRLDDISLFSHDLPDDNGEEILVHPLAALQLEKVVKQALTETDAGWQNQIRLPARMIRCIQRFSLRKRTTIRWGGQAEG